MEKSPICLIRSACVRSRSKYPAYLISSSSEGIISAELEIKYAGYFERERTQADRIKQMGDFSIPSNLPYAEMNSLSIEARQKLQSIQPRTLAQASRTVSYTHLRAHETDSYLVCRLL